jgi:16S rRNA U1498 N3-methylase RsmE
MRTQSLDTSPEMERVQIDMLRKTSITKKFAMIEAWSRFITEAAKQGIRRDNPNASEEEVALMLVARQYGEPLAEKIRAELVRRRG